MSAAPETLLDVKDVVQRYKLPRESLFRPPGEVLALNGVSARIEAGKSLGVVGESGSGQVDIRPRRDGAGAADLGRGKTARP